MAAESMQDIKRRIKSVTSTERITNSMKLVSAGKLRKAKAIFEKTNENSHFITQTISELFNSGEDVPKEFLAGAREVKTTAYIVITSSRGLCGGFNTNVLKRAQAEINAGEGKPIILTIGQKSKDYFSKRGYEIVGEYLEAPEAITFLEAKAVISPLLEMYERGEVDKIQLIYTSFKSAMEQVVVSNTMLPFSIEENIDENAISHQVDYEPSPEVVFNYLIPKYVEIMIYSAVVESATCEHAARRMAMENATDNAREMLGNLNLTYNRARQTAITNEIIEIVAGSEAQH
ncbi:MAG: ATP synthase F1 subunit gamma [Clostridiales bacterium]|nr:ATP synthase F1 subunit gamma [Candidatus Crickella merdequi]